MPSEMMSFRWLTPVKRAIQRLTLYVCAVGMIWVLVMMLLTTSDVITRYFLGWPVPGTKELSEFMLAIFGLLGMAYTQQVGGHVRVTLLVSQLSPPAQLVIDSIATLFSLFIISLIVWQGWVVGIDDFYAGTCSDALRIPTFPFRLLVSVGAFFLCLELLINLIASIGRLVTGLPEKSQIFLG